MNLYKCRRKKKRLVNWYLKHAGFGTFVINCRSHPSKVIEIERYTNDVYGCGMLSKSLVDGVESFCSYLHCCPDVISQEQAHKLAKDFK